MGGGGREIKKKHFCFQDRFKGRENLKKIYIFTTVVFGEKIKNFLFSLPFFGEKIKKKLFFTTFGLERKFKKYFLYSRPFFFWGGERK